MFESRHQSFADRNDPSRGPTHLALLRAELGRMGLDGFIVPRSDEHQNEYVQPHSERLAWLTGFTGSAGMAVVLKDRAAIFIDGRYTLQAREQVDAKAFAHVHLIDHPPEVWIEAQAKAGERIGYDPWLMTPGQLKRFAAAAKSAGAQLVAVDENPIDKVWHDRPEPGAQPIWFHPPRHAGETSKKKLARAQKALGKADALVVTDPHNVAWLFNIRGGDVSHTPLPMGFALVPAKGRPHVFIDGRKIKPAVRAKLAALAEIDEPHRLGDMLCHLGREAARVRFDASSAPARLVHALEEAGGEADVGMDPVSLLKASKNEVELEGSRNAHLRDGAAMAQFLCWLDEEAPKGRLTEIDAAKALEHFRHETGELRGLSFPSISAAGPNSALPHYRVSERSNRRLAKGLYLIDSGGQYEDGTTDITRTVAVGKPSSEMRDRFTRVLKGHIAIAQAVFPKGTSGAQIDALARQYLWEAGLDFDHGTGHGIGSFLSVHEGPQRISKAGHATLAEGMILSNEPGYYKEGHWGIRIENLLVVERRAIKGAEREMLGFETVTLAPIDLRLVDDMLLTRFEVAWLDSYHAWVRKTLSPLVDSKTRKWLAQATRKISKV